jgi:hypothetical protein
MKTKLMILIIASLLMMSANAYAGGDLIVEGKVGVGIVTEDQGSPTLNAQLDVRGDAVFNITRDNDVAITGISTKIVDNQSVGNKKGVIGLSATIEHTSNKGARGWTGASISMRLKGSATGSYKPHSLAILKVFGSYHSSGNYSFQDGIYGLNIGFPTTYSGTGTISGKNLKFLRIAGLTGPGNGKWNFENVYGLDIRDMTLNPDDYTIRKGTRTNTFAIHIEKQTDTNTTYKGAIWLDGEGEGADIVFGTNKEARIYLENGVLYATDNAFNVTQISPHDPETGEWVFYSKNLKTGKVVRVNMEKLIRAVEKLTGEKFMIETYEEISK